jgi:hypothetical protein
MSSRAVAVFARPLRRIRSQLKRSVAHRGVLLTLCYVPVFPLAKLLVRLRNLTPRRRLDEAQSRRESDEFDRAFHVDTAGLVFPEEIEVVGPNRDHGHAYLGIRPRDFRELLAAIPVPHERYMFVDYGSGKGRALLLAAEWPFKAVIGLEFAPVLHRIAETNIQTYRNPACRCRAVRTLCMDAVEFELPREPAILYFFNPFSEAVLSAVLKQVQRSLEASPRDLWIGYQCLWAHRPLDRAPFLERVAATPFYRIYRSRSR